MSEITNVIVSFLFLPVTVFIIIPLVMLCGWLFFKLLMQLKMRLTIPQQKNQLENGITQAGGSRNIY